MIELSKIPKRILSLLPEKGFDGKDCLVALTSDRSLDAMPRELYAFLFADRLLLIEGVGAVKEEEEEKNHGRKKAAYSFEETLCRVYTVAELSDFKIDTLISGVRLSARKKEAGSVTLLVASNLYKDCAYDFMRALQMLTKDGNLDAFEVKDKMQRCPKCGMVYPDQHRPICPKCMEKSKIIRRMGIFFVRYRWKIALCIFLMVMVSVLGVLTPYISSAFFYDQVLDKSVGSSYYGKVGLVITLIIAARLLSAFFDIINQVIQSIIGADIIYDLRKTIFGAIERLSLSFFTSRQTGGLITQVNSDASSMHWFFSDGLPWIIVNAVQIIAITVIMFCINAPLSVAALFFLPAFVACLNSLYHNEAKLNNKRFSSSRSLSSLLSDVLVGFRLVKAFSKEKAEAARFEARNKRLGRDTKASGYYSALAYPPVYFMLKICNFLVWGFGGWMVIKGEITYGILATFVSYTHLVHNPMDGLVGTMQYFSEFTNASSRLLEIMDAEPEVREAEHPVPMPEMRGDIVFDRVAFSYEKNRRVIDGISFSVEAGKTLGIVGHTGAGKSTLANLLVRLYDPEEGSVSIDGTDIRNISFADLRKNIAIVSQETYLFIGSLFENIRYAKPDATREEVIRAAKMAGAHDFIIKLPEGYDTVIGEGEKSLSGGERQRVSIARAILQNPKILILDEATAAMDTETERKIQNALDTLTKGKTTVIIAHRLSTLRNADKLIVIEDGKMPESGTHAELLTKKDGIYHRLYMLQLEALKNVAIEE